MAPFMGLTSPYKNGPTSAELVRQAFAQKCLHFLSSDGLPLVVMILQVGFRPGAETRVVGIYYSDQFGEAPLRKAAKLYGYETGPLSNFANSTRFLFCADIILSHADTAKQYSLASDQVLVKLSSKYQQLADDMTAAKIWSATTGRDPIQIGFVTFKVYTVLVPKKLWLYQPQAVLDARTAWADMMTGKSNTYNC
jgi:hypothetical protein